MALWWLADPFTFLLSERDRRLSVAISRFNGFAPVMTSPVDRVASALTPKSTPITPWFSACGKCDLSSVSTLILAYHRLAVREMMAERILPLNRQDSRIRTQPRLGMQMREALTANGSLVRVKRSRLLPFFLYCG